MNAVAGYRVLVTGSRDWPYEEAVRRALEEVRARVAGPLVVVHGACLVRGRPAGADWMADRWARTLAAQGAAVEVERHFADVRRFGPWPGTGPVRNRHMVALGAQECLAFIYRGSAGATGCADLAEAVGIRVTRYVAPRPVRPAA